jgi:hypothetical protein
MEGSLSEPLAQALASPETVAGLSNLSTQQLDNLGNRPLTL